MAPSGLGHEGQVRSSDPRGVPRRPGAEGSVQLRPSIDFKAVSRQVFAVAAHWELEYKVS